MLEIFRIGRFFLILGWCLNPSIDSTCPRQYANTQGRRGNNGGNACGNHLERVEASGPGSLGSALINPHREAPSPICVCITAALYSTEPPTTLYSSGPLYIRAQAHFILGPGPNPKPAQFISTWAFTWATSLELGP